MSTGIVLINGLKFPYFLVDYAIAWAQKNDIQLTAIFMRAKDVDETEYDLADNLSKISNDIKKELAINNNDILKDQVAFFIDTSSSMKVKCNARIMLEPSLASVLEKIEEAKVLFVAPGYCNEDMLPVNSFDLNDALKKVKCKVEVVKELRN